MLKMTGSLFSTVLLGLTALGSSLPSAHANTGSQFGPAVDAACLAFNGTTPFSDQGCALCHTSNFAQRVEPAWTWWFNQNFTAFCPAPANQAPNGVIDEPAFNLTILTGESVNFMGSGSDPDNNLPLTYNWNFGGGLPNSTLEDPGNLTFNSQGVFTVTFTVTDNLGLSDPSPDTVTITVNDSNPTCTDFDGDLYATEGGVCGPVDCNDTDPLVNPGVQEICTDGIDNNCNTLIDTVDPTAIDCPAVESCPDSDGDMFSPSGGVCGPVDCDDDDAAINPGAAEVCDDGIDNDCDNTIDGSDSECDGSDCLAPFFFAPPVIIHEAEWDDEDSELEIEGFGANPGAKVSVINAATGVLLGTTVADSFGEWEFELDDPEPVPCVVRIEIEGQYAQIPVEHCDKNDVDNTDHVNIKRAQWKKGKIKVKGFGAPPRAFVRLSNAETGELLATTFAKKKGAWKFKVKIRATPPCRVRVEIDGQHADREVSDAPDNCR